jgi:hypothetical protein
VPQVAPDPIDRRSRNRRSRRASPELAAVRTGPSIDDAHEIRYFRRHADDDPSQATPARDYLRTCDPNVRAKFAAALAAVAAAPPHKFAGGGYWEAMHGEMTGWYEVRVSGRHRVHHRLFCLIDLAAQGAVKPWLVVVTGMSKPFRTTFSQADYLAVRLLGGEYLTRNPRSVC